MGQEKSFYVESAKEGETVNSYDSYAGKRDLSERSRDVLPLFGDASFLRFHSQKKSELPHGLSPIPSETELPRPVRSIAKLFHQIARASNGVLVIKPGGIGGRVDPRSFWWRRPWRERSRMDEWTRRSRG